MSVQIEVITYNKGIKFLNLKAEKFTSGSGSQRSQSFGQSCTFGVAESLRMPRNESYYRLYRNVLEEFEF